MGWVICCSFVVISFIDRELSQPDFQSWLLFLMTSFTLRLVEEFNLMKIDAIVIVTIVELWD